MAPPPSAQVGDALHLDDGELRRGEHHHVDLLASCSERAAQRRQIPRGDGFDRQVRAFDVGQGVALGRDADDVEQRRRAVARHRRAHVLGRVGGRHPLDAFDHRHFPVGSGAPADDGAEHAPVGQLFGLGVDREAPRRAPMLVEMQPVARGLSGQAGRQRRRSAFEVRARTAEAVRVDHHARVAVGDVVAAYRRHDDLVVDAGVGHDDAHGTARLDEAPLDVGHGLGLAQRVVVVEVDPARVGDRRDGDAALAFGQGGEAFHQLHSGEPDGLRVGHHVGLAHLDHVGGVEHAPDLELVLDGPAARRAQLARQHGLGACGELHYPSRRQSDTFGSCARRSSTRLSCLMPLTSTVRRV